MKTRGWCLYLRILIRFIAMKGSIRDGMLSKPVKICFLSLHGLTFIRSSQEDHITYKYIQHEADGQHFQNEG